MPANHIDAEVVSRRLDQLIRGRQATIAAGKISSDDAEVERLMAELAREIPETDAELTALEKINRRVGFGSGLLLGIVLAFVLAAYFFDRSDLIIWTAVAVGGAGSTIGLAISAYMERRTAIIRRRFNEALAKVKTLPGF